MPARPAERSPLNRAADDAAVGAPWVHTNAWPHAALAFPDRARAIGRTDPASLGTWHRRRVAIDHCAARSRIIASELRHGRIGCGTQRAVRPADRLGHGALPLSRPQPR